MRFLLSILLSALMLSACGLHSYDYQSEKNPTQWQGRNISALQQRWGMPDQTIHTRSGKSYYLYITNAGGNIYNATKFNVALGTSSNESFNALPMRTRSMGNMGLKCSTLFTTDAKGTIVGVSHKGSNCGGEWAPRN